MCQRVVCRQCRKPTWAGCGAHIEQALAGVPREARCGCREQGTKLAEVPATDTKPKRRFGLF